MRDAHSEFVRRGARVVTIGNGQPFHAAAFREEAEIPFDLWVDPEMQAYRAAGLRRSKLRALSPRTLGHALRAMRAGHRQTRVRGDPWQTGGAFVITPRGETVYAQVSREPGDHAPVADLMAALDDRSPAAHDPPLPR